MVTPVESEALGTPEPLQPVRTSNVPAAVLWMVGTLLAFSLMAISVRQLGRILNLYELLMVRSVGGLVILLIVMAAQPALFGTLALRKPGMHLLRNGSHFIANLGWTNAVIVLPLATVFAIEFLMPVWAGLLAVVLLGERFTAGRAGTIVLGFLGVLVILRPGIEAFQPAALGVLVASFGYAASNIATKKLIPVQSTLAIIFWMNVMQIGMALPGINLDFPARLASHQWLWAFGLAFGGAFAHYCLTNALRVADAIVVIPLDFIRIPLIAFVGWQFYGEPLNPYVFLGSVCIIVGLLYSLHREAKPA